MGEAQCPEANMVALARTVVDGLLETYVLSSSEEIERAERGRRIRSVEQKRSYHSPRACNPQTIGCRPACCRKRIAKLLLSAYQYEIHGITGQTVSSNRVSGNESPVENLQAHPDHVWQNDVGSQPVGKTDGQDPVKSVVRGIENDKDDQPNAKHSQTEDEKPLEKQRERPQILGPRMAPATNRRIHFSTRILPAEA